MHVNISDYTKYNTNNATYLDMNYNVAFLWSFEDLAKSAINLKNVHLYQTMKTGINI